MTNEPARETGIVRVHARISGRVQGVAYRWSTRSRALELSLTGWVRNCASGDVEAEFQGRAEDVSAMVAWCHEGPASAHVTAVVVTDRAACGAEEEFVIRG